MATMNATALANATHLLAQEGATLVDAVLIAARHANWHDDGRPLLVIDGDQLHANPANLSWIKAFLAAAANQRREDRIEHADQELTAAHEALLLKNRARRSPSWESEMLGAFRRLTGALVELIDAREDASEISADQANRLRTSAQAQLRQTEEIGMNALSGAIRLARKY